MHNRYVEHRMGGFPELVHRRGGGGGVEKDEEEGKWRVCGGEGVRERERETALEGGGGYILHRLTKYGHREMSETRERSLVTDLSVLFCPPPPLPPRPKVLTVLSSLHCAVVRLILDL